MIDIKPLQQKPDMVDATVARCSSLGFSVGRSGTAPSGMGSAGLALPFFSELAAGLGIFGARTASVWLPDFGLYYAFGFNRRLR